jgi:hypothetical protein
VGQWLHSGGWKTNPREFFAGRLRRSTQSALISCGTVQGVSDHSGVLLDVEWVETGFMTQEKRLVLVYHKKCVRATKFLRDKLPTWANNGSYVEDIWKNFKDMVFGGIKRFVRRKILKQNPNSEYYSKEVKRLKVNRRNLGDHYQAELKILSNELLTAKRNTQETLLSSVLQNESKSWSDFCRFINRRKGKGGKYSYDQGLKWRARH